MNENVRLPIKTVREGNKITKICVEDFYKVINRTQEAMTKAWNKSIDVLDSIHKEVDDYEGELIVGTGISCPCLTDAFDEEIGNNIAFMKAKLNANIKKFNKLVQVYNEYVILVENINKDLLRIESNIKYDLNGLRQYNPEYLSYLEFKLGIY